MSDTCVFRKERDGRFSGCIALKVGSCPAKCNFQKTEKEYNQGMFNAENRLRKMGLQAAIVEGVGGERYVTVKIIPKSKNDLKEVK